MATQKRHFDAWQEALKIISRCPVCNQQYVADQAKIFAKQEGARMAHFTCGSCHSAFVAMIVFVGHGLSSLGMVTDLSFEDAERLHKAEPISVDELIEGRQYIQSSFV